MISPYSNGYIYTCLLFKVLLTHNDGSQQLCYHVGLFIMRNLIAVAIKTAILVISGPPLLCPEPHHKNMWLQDIYCNTLVDLSV